MSVINQMLQDLEQRKITSRVTNHYIDEVNIVAKKGMTPWFILLIITLGIIIFLFYSFSVTKQTKQQAVIELPLLEKNTSIKIENKQKKAEEKAEFKTAEVKKETDITAKKTEPASSPVTHLKDESIINKVSEKTIEANIRSHQSKIRKTGSTVNKINKANKHYSKTPVQKNNSVIINNARQLMTNDVTKAIGLLELNLKEITPSPDYYALLANLYLRKQRYNDAILFYQRALKQEQDKGEYWIGLALSYKGKGEIIDSKKAFKQASYCTNISSQLKLYAKQQYTK
ncbi:MAG: hypothetical protein DRQ43_09685 [Gammaproteobacteria bacterium]|nr:MAG: hypothetical protein DRQ43_09685 [Gammaproteobacteria bacterium]